MEPKVQRSETLGLLSSDSESPEPAARDNRCAAQGGDPTKEGSKPWVGEPITIRAPPRGATCVEPKVQRSETLGLPGTHRAGVPPGGTA